MRPARRFRRSPLSVFRSKIILRRNRRPVPAWIGGIGFTAADIASVTVDLDSISETDFALVVNFTPAGHAKFREAQRCRPSQFLEISIDGRAITRPALMEEITGPSLAIASSFTRETATALRDRIATSGTP